MPGPSLNPHIRTARLLLRPAIPSDAAGVTALFANPDTTAQEASSRQAPQASIELYTEKIEKWRGMRERGENCFLVIVKPGLNTTGDATSTSSGNANGSTSSDAVIGIGGINAFKQTPTGQRVADVGVAVDSSQWGHGYGREAFVATLECVFGPEAACEEAWFETRAENAAFRALVRRLGLGDIETQRVNERGEGECGYVLTRERWVRFLKERKG